MEINKQDYNLFLQFKQFMNMQDNSQLSSTKPKKKRREKGTGSITRLSGKRIRPYMATWTTGYNDNDEGQQMQIPLAYFKEYEHANKALDLYMLEKDSRCAIGTVSEYIYNVDGKLSKNCTLIQQNAHTNVFEGNKQKMKDCPTLKVVWNKVLNSDLAHLNSLSLTNYRSSFNKFKTLHNRKLNTITLSDLQPIFDKQMKDGICASTLNRMKIIINSIFKYGMKYDYIEKNYAQYITFKEVPKDGGKKHKVPYSNELIKKLFKHDDNLIVQSILIMIYTGMRPSELLKLKKDNINLEERYMIGGMKTENGKNRIIPIHECIVHYIENIMNSEILKMTYATYLNKYNIIKSEMKFECTPHSGRHTFATLANENGLNEFLVKRIMGHSARDLTKDVYTHVDAKRLVKEINKLPTLK